MAFVQAHNVSLAFGDRDILKGVTISVASGDRIALTGANGSGKTTLMKILAGFTVPDGGEIVVSREAKVSYLPQSGIVHEGSTLLEEAERAFDPLRELQITLESLGKELSGHTESTPETEKLLNRHHELQERLQESGFYSRRERIEQVLFGLGFTRDDLSRTTEEFSGGWQMRIALSKVLLEYPEIMLLDEPTNYLDLETTEWLRGFLSSYRGGVLVVSHDRFFLDATIRQVAELFNGRLKLYRGSFTGYQTVRSRELESLRAQYERQQEEIAKIEDFIRRFRVNASKAQLVQSRIKQLEKMERIELPETMKRIHFSFPPPPHSGKKVLTLSGLGKAYGERTVFSDLGLELERGEKLVIVGKNGAGKSSLMRIIAGDDRAFTGELSYGTDVKVGYFSQDQADSLSHEATVIEEIESAAPISLYPQLRNLLGAFLFRGDDIYKPISVLSGGEKSRLSLLELLLTPVNLLVLDEPTNHLDMHSKDVLLDALSSYEGTVIFVSHDRYFIESLATKVLSLEETGPRLYYGTYSYYLWKRERLGESDADGIGSDLGSVGSERSVPTEEPALSEAARSREEQKRLKTELRRLEREEEQLMSRLEELELERQRLEHALGDPRNYTDGGKMRELRSLIDENTAEQGRLSARWESIEPELARLRKELS
jgi:ATP-binding cassette subfamily F protein 3